MNKLWIHQARTWTERNPESPDELDALKAGFGARVARRMTRLGMMMSDVLSELEIAEPTSIVYATTYSETRAIEKFLDSFPYPSPQGFQTSIHPSGVEQFLIQRKHALDEYFPLAGGHDIFIRGLDSLLGCAHANLVYCGGEERGTWLEAMELSSRHNFAWALRLSASSEGAIGAITWESSGEFGPDFNICALVDAIRGREAFIYQNAESGRVELTWSV